MANNKSVETHDIHLGLAEKLTYFAERLNMVCNSSARSVSVPKESKLKI